MKKFLKEKEAALEKQWQECEKLKEEAVAMACEALTRKLRAEFLIEKEQAVTEALRIAKVGVVSVSTLTICLFYMYVYFNFKHSLGKFS